MITRLTLLLLGPFLLWAPAPTAATTWLIRPDGMGDAPTIRAAVDSAAGGDTLLLAPGTFAGEGNRDVDYLGKAIVITSQSGPEVTVVDCDGAGRGFIFENGEGTGSVLCGLTVRNANSTKSAGAIMCIGASPTITGNVIESANAGGGGGAFFCLNAASPIIDANTIAGNSSAQGGAIWCGNASSPTITGNVISGNTSAVFGGAIYCWAFSRPLIAGNTIVRNSAGGQGGGIYCTDSSPMITNNIIAFSTSGEAIACATGSSPLLMCNDIFGNAGGDAICGRDGGDNFSLDPRFCGVPGSGNFFLQSISPCAPDNSPCGGLVGALGVNCGTTATREASWGALKHHYRQE
jgi:predicted outer membrane repeat protein